MKPTIVNSQIVHENPWYRVRHDELLLTNGKKGNYYVSEFPGAAIMVCVRNQQILTVTQYRYPIDKTNIELPVGRREPNEQPEETAKRELKEETGYDCKDIKFLGQLWSLKGAVHMALFVYAIEVSDEAGAQSLDTLEVDLSAHWMDIAEWRRAILDGRVADCESIAAWTLYQETLASKNQT